MDGFFALLSEFKLIFESFYLIFQKSIVFKSFLSGPGPGANALPGSLSLLAIPLTAAWPRKPSASPKPNKATPDALAARKEARDLRQKGEYLRAGELFELGGEFDHAVSMFKKLNDATLLGDLYRRNNKYREAAQAYMDSKEFDQAARMFESAGDFKKAAELFEGINQNARAAEAWEKAKNFEAAAGLLKQSGKWEKAAKVYLKGGIPLKAAELYEAQYLREKPNWDKKGVSGGLKKTIMEKFALESARIYKENKHPAKAARLFMSLNQDEEAAEAYQSAGELAKAAEIYTRIKRYPMAAQLYRKLGENDKAVQITAEMHIQKKNFSSAAEVFAGAEDFPRAGEYYERAGLLDLAGQMYLQAGDFGRAGEMMRSLGNVAVAAEMFEQAGRVKDAAELHQQAGNQDRALALWVKSGDAFKAGVLCHETGRFDDSIHHLQKLGPENENYIRASILLGRMFLERGMEDAAKDRYKKITASQKINEETIESFYNLATILEGEGNHQDALGLYENILARDYGYSDVKKRVAGIKEALSSNSGARPAADSKGRYRILKEIGRGGMGIVYLAEDTLLGRKVAFKELPHTLKGDPKMLESILQEARMVAALNHPNIVTIHDACDTGDNPYLIMEYVEGVTLNQVLIQAPIMPPNLIAEISIQVCAALEYAHSKKLVHRDIKPANIMTSQGRSVKVMDFGIAKIVTSGMVEATSIKGSPHFMSPEQIMGTVVSHQTDIYSLGCTLYRMTAGHPPFIEGDVFYHHCHTPVEPPKAVNPDTPEILNDIILKCMEKDPARRFENVGELSDQLKRLI